MPAQVSFEGPAGCLSSSGNTKVTVTCRLKDTGFEGGDCAEEKWGSTGVSGDGH